MSVADMAEQLSRSKSWVSTRLELLEEMSPRVKRGYLRRPFPRAGKQELEEFVLAVSGQKLRVQEIEQLAHGYFRGPQSMREMIQIESRPTLCSQSHLLTAGIVSCSVLFR
jgi:hypothetical protein